MMWDPFMIHQRGLGDSSRHEDSDKGSRLAMPYVLYVAWVLYVSERQTQNSERETPSAKRGTRNSERQTQNAYPSLPRAASDMIFSSVASPRSNSPVNFPRHITRTRSARASTSGRSLEMTRMARPSWAS